MVQPEGNYYDKYHSKNPIVKYMMKNFFGELHKLLNKTYNISTILEAGCGEGEVTNYLKCYYDNNCEIDAFDISDKVIDEAGNKYTGINFYTDSIYDMKLCKSKYDLVICSEVLEHLDYPEDALRQLNSVAGKYIILSVPNEPVWRILNMCRCKYLTSLGNTPGHVNHWSTKGFVKFLKDNGFIVEAVSRPFPWTMVLIKVNGN